MIYSPLKPHARPRTIFDFDGNKTVALVSIFYRAAYPRFIWTLFQRYAQTIRILGIYVHTERDNYVDTPNGNTLFMENMQQYSYFYENWLSHFLSHFDLFVKI